MKFRKIALLSLFIPAISFAKTPLVLLSIDGFAQHYIEAYKPKTLISLINEGTSATLLPLFPSKTFPNHVSIVTGKYPVNHGIVHNSFYHRDIEKNYRLGDGRKDQRWLTAKPIWHLNEEQGNTSAIYFWPESESAIDGKTASIVEPYDHSISNEKRLDKIIDWLRLPEAQRPNFIAGYFSSVDSAGHDFGANSQELIRSIEDLDALLASFVKQIKTEFNGNVNLIVVSDHGMTKINKTPLLQWKDKVEDGIKVAKSSTQLYLYSDNKKALQLTENHFLSDKKGLKGYEVYKFPDYPSHWQLNTKTPSTPDMVINAKTSYIFDAGHSDIDPETHGYDPKGQDDLNAIFIGMGPMFEKNKVIPAFENIHVLPILTRALALKDVTDIDGNYQIADSIFSNTIK